MASVLDRYLHVVVDLVKVKKINRILNHQSQIIARMILVYLGAHLYNMSALVWIHNTGNRYSVSTS